MLVGCKRSPKLHARKDWSSKWQKKLQNKPRLALTAPALRGMVGRVEVVAAMTGATSAMTRRKNLKKS